MTCHNAYFAAEEREALPVALKRCRLHDDPALPQDHMSSMLEVCSQESSTSSEAGIPVSKLTWTHKCLRTYAGLTRVARAMT